MTRRAFLLTPFIGQALANESVHVEGVLTPTDSANLEGYYALCGDNACRATDAIGLSVHPTGFWAKSFQMMANRRVQVSVFPVK